MLQPTQHKWQWLGGTRTDGLRGGDSKECSRAQRPDYKSANRSVYHERHGEIRPDEQIQGKGACAPKLPMMP